MGGTVRVVGGKSKKVGKSKEKKQKLGKKEEGLGLGPAERWLVVVLVEVLHLHRSRGLLHAGMVIEPDITASTVLAAVADRSLVFSKRVASMQHT